MSDSDALKIIGDFNATRGKHFSAARDLEAEHDAATQRIIGKLYAIIKRQQDAINDLEESRSTLKRKAEKKRKRESYKSEKVSSSVKKYRGK